MEIVVIKMLGEGCDGGLGDWMGDKNVYHSISKPARLAFYSLYLVQAGSAPAAPQVSTSLPLKIIVGFK